MTGVQTCALPILWFKELPFDHTEMEAVIIDKKISNLIGVLNWDLSSTHNYLPSDLFRF